VVEDITARREAELELRTPLNGVLGMYCSIDVAVPRRVRGDPVRVRQILANFLSNTLKFTQRGEITLRVLPGEPGRIRLEVHDSGIGISPAARERLFRPFSQADSSTTRRFGGTGLGLSVCRELAQRMDGTVGADSDDASGSCFWAELALPVVSAGVAGTEAGSEPPRLQPLVGMVVLVAEDNPGNTPTR